MSSLRSQFLRAIEDQREEIRMVSKRNYIKRDLMNYYSLTGDLIKIILGVRRSGKSTFAQLMLSGNDFAYLNFDDERLVGLTANDLNTLLECLHEVYGDFSYLFLDEIQNIPEWSLFVNRLKRLGIKLVVTGSNSKMLSKELASHLTGRYEMAELYPFSFTEYLRYCKINPEGGDTKTFGMIRNKFNEYLQRGGFPEVMESDRPGRVISELFNSVVSKDILYRYKVRHQRTFKEIALTLVGNYGREISFNNIRKQFSIGSDHTVKNYVEYLEEAYLVLTLTK
ncbi:MAG: ATP-binding protein, partial [Bacteroidetes bacterium]|nr:ATP-binding protein [Bacteroidota bacterium]